MSNIYANKNKPKDITRNYSSFINLFTNYLITLLIKEYTTNNIHLYANMGNSLENREN